MPDRLKSRRGHSRSSNGQGSSQEHQHHHQQQHHHHQQQQQAEQAVGHDDSNLAGNEPHSLPRRAYRPLAPLAPLEQRPGEVENSYEAYLRAGGKIELDSAGRPMNTIENAAAGFMTTQADYAAPGPAYPAAPAEYQNPNQDQQVHVAPGQQQAQNHPRLGLERLPGQHQHHHRQISAGSPPQHGHYPAGFSYQAAAAGHNPFTTESPPRTGSTAGGHMPSPTGPVPPGKVTGYPPGFELHEEQPHQQAEYHHHRAPARQNGYGGSAPQHGFFTSPSQQQPHGFTGGAPAGSFPAGPQPPYAAVSLASAMRRPPPPPSIDSDQPAAPRQRTSIACRYCRKRKIRCTGFSVSGKCQNCLRMGIDCLFVPVSSGPGIPSAFVPISALPGGIIPPGTQLYGAFGEPIGLMPGHIPGVISAQQLLQLAQLHQQNSAMGAASSSPSECSESPTGRGTVTGIPACGFAPPQSSTPPSLWALPPLPPSPFGAASAGDQVRGPAGPVQTARPPHTASVKGSPESSSTRYDFQGPPPPQHAADGSPTEAHGHLLLGLYQQQQPEQNQDQMLQPPLPRQQQAPTSNRRKRRSSGHSHDSDMQQGQPASKRPSASASGATASPADRIAPVGYINVSSAGHLPQSGALALRTGPAAPEPFSYTPRAVQLEQQLRQLHLQRQQLQMQQQQQHQHQQHSAASPAAFAHSHSQMQSPIDHRPMFGHTQHHGHVSSPMAYDSGPSSAASSSAPANPISQQQRHQPQPPPLAIPQPQPQQAAQLPLPVPQHQPQRPNRNPVMSVAHLVNNEFTHIDQGMLGRLNTTHHKQ